MNCEKCGTVIPVGEERDSYDRSLCEDCYMDSLSPTRTCDPWSVHSAKTLGEAGGGFVLTALQSKILGLLGETGGAERKYLVDQIGISFIELEREIAALRHMEKVRGELREGKKFVTLW
jgi:hypothetical protein